MQKILLTSLVAGFIAGFFVFAVQSFKLTPLIIQAEAYENLDSTNKDSGNKGLAKASMDIGHHHDHGSAETWKPTGSFERGLYTLVTNLGMSIGFALILVGAFTLRGDSMDVRRGVLWGLAGFATFSLAPSFGLPSELPGTMAGDLFARQTWWIGTALATAFGIYTLVFSRSNSLKVLGLAAIALPQIIGAPIAPLGGVAPTELNAQFAAASLVTMAMFWVVLGAASGWFYGRNSTLASVQ